ncbi:MAG TPA: hypothetical protein VMV94_05985, partial [Phycisphaerae bacterium]|nr:hypothetical protein [Phycisphaerae bacterium]
MAPMKDGAVVILDVLGFKGIWRRRDPGDVIRKMHLLGKVGEAIRKNQLMRLSCKAVRRNVVVLSDTIVVTCHLDSVEGSPPDVVARARALSVYVACKTAATAISLVASSETGGPDMALRGCVSIGEFDPDGTTIIGEAVDDAAEYEKLAQAAIVWFTPGARTRYESLRNSGAMAVPASTPLLEKPLIVHDYAVPLKDGRSFLTLAINPFGGPERPRGEAEIIRDRILATFSADALDVQL